MRRVVVGTAGHIDHGKTALVRALTGIDCDRWVEEKERGITIDLGFAVLREDNLQIGFVDVPGHERFLHNALAGLGGIRLMLLVVAADEGVKPQTREHLAICSLLGIPAGLVALTKKDLVSDDLLELAHLEAEELLAGTPFAEAPILAVSSVTGEGVEELRETLLRLAAEYETVVDPDRPTRLPLDRAFHLKGLGVVVTGTLVSGAVHPGDTLEILPGGNTVRVRSVQVHGEDREEAAAGERTSLQITGAELDDLRRGLQLVAPGCFDASRRLMTRFRLLQEAPKAIESWTPIRLHLSSSQLGGELRPLSVGKLEPGEEALVEMRLAHPAVAVRGDRYILTRPSPATTLGGGVVLDPGWRRLRGKFLDRALKELAGDPDGAIAFWVLDAGEKGLGAGEPARRLGVRRESVVPRLEALATEGRLIEVPEGHGHRRRWIAPAAWKRVVERARRVLKRYFEKDRLAQGIPKAEAVRRILPGRGSELAGTYLPWLQKQKVLVVSGDRVNLPDRRVELTGEESELSRAVLDRFERAGLEPPSPGEVQEELGAKPQILEGMLRYLVESGKLVRLPGGLMLAASALAELESDLREAGWERFTVGDFKDRYGLSRKWAIPLLERLDSTGVTRRLGDERMVVGDR
jgi:selenocysteine-specific elongation factor